MIHCHNLVHEDHDMMSQFSVGLPQSDMDSNIGHRIPRRLPPTTTIRSRPIRRTWTPVRRIEADPGAHAERRPGAASLREVAFRGGGGGGRRRHGDHPGRVPQHRHGVLRQHGADRCAPATCWWSARLHDGNSVQDNDIVTFTSPRGRCADDQAGGRHGRSDGRDQGCGTVCRRAEGVTSPTSTTPASTGSTRRPCTVPDGTVFLMGDHRETSIDSRIYGPVPTSAIDGRLLVDRSGPPADSRDRRECPIDRNVPTDERPDDGRW